MKTEFADARAVIDALRPSYPVYCLRPDVLAAAAQRFLQQFPGRVLYAVKCNPHPQVLQALYEGGIRHFDTASLPEVAQIREAFPETDAYFMHPVKARAAIHTAWYVYGVQTYVVDHMNELQKVLEETGGGREIAILARLNTPAIEGTFYHLSAKFGCEAEAAAELLRAIHARGCQVGIAFHVGSQCLHPSAYRDALRRVGEVMAMAPRVPIRYLDVGGGFPARYLGTQMPPLSRFVKAIEEGVAQLPLAESYTLMCEPGRALVADGLSLIVQVQLRKGNQIYINDGIYGSLSELVTAGIRLPCRLIRLSGEPDSAMADFTVNGPTCDSLDVMPGPFSLPKDVREGDWIEIDRVGAYSTALASHFNGFYPETLVTVRDQPLGAKMLDASYA